VRARIAGVFAKAIPEGKEEGGSEVSLPGDADEVVHASHD
jgi:hypothetical protein